MVTLVTKVNFQSFTELGTYRGLVVNHRFVSVVAGAIQVETMHIHTILWRLFDLFHSLSFEHSERELQFVDRDLVLTRVGLQTTSHEALREEESGNPV